MWVTRQPHCASVRRADFLTIIHQVLFAEAALKIGACVDARCAMGLKKYQVTAMLIGTCATARFKKMIKARFE